MMTYGELNLKKLREKCDLDFAHYTYINGMCSCCYGPADLPAKYWRNNEVISRDDPRYDTIEYILFKNANNGGGQVKSSDTICVPGSNKKWMFCPRHTYTVYIQWRMSEEKLNEVLKQLRRQLDEDYHVIRPRSVHSCIEICTTEDMDEERWKLEVRLDPARPVECVMEDLDQQGKVFTCECESTGDKYIVFAEDYAKALEKCDSYIQEGFEIDHLQKADQPGVYY